MNRTTFYWVFGIALILAYFVTLGTVAGQEYDVTTEDGTVLRGEGFQGVPPSYLTLLKVESRHSGDFLGSGAFLTDRLVLTCYHNVRGLRKSDRIGIHLTSGTVYWNTKVVHVAPRYDLALILVKDDNIEYHRTLAVCDTPAPFVSCAAMGFSPPDNALRLQQGAVTGRKYGNRWGDTMIFYEIDTPIAQGMSGGPVINGDLELVGVGVASDGKCSHVTMLRRIHQFLDSYKGEIGTIVD
jgi:hypothetical protein